MAHYGVSGIVSAVTTIAVSETLGLGNETESDIKSKCLVLPLKHGPNWGLWLISMP